LGPLLAVARTEKKEILIAEKDLKLKLYSDTNNTAEGVWSRLLQLAEKATGQPKRLWGDQDDRSESYEKAMT